MTLELSADDLRQVIDAANEYGACLFKTQTVDGEPVWLKVEGSRAPRKRAPRTNRPEEAANAHPEQLTPQPLTNTPTQ